jgi:hypothetical protein
MVLHPGCNSWLNICPLRPPSCSPWCMTTGREGELQEKQRWGTPPCLQESWVTRPIAASSWLPGNVVWRLRNHLEESVTVWSISCPPSHAHFYNHQWQSVLRDKSLFGNSVSMLTVVKSKWLPLLSFWPKIYTPSKTALVLFM